MDKKTHIVKQGESLASISKKYGYRDWRKIYDDPENKELKKKRPNPNILYPGDKIVIPDKSTKEDSGKTEQRHRFRLKGDSLWLRIIFKDNNNEALANISYKLNIGGQTIEGQTNNEGLLEQRIPYNLEKGHLTIQNRDYLLKIGHLDPIDTVTGVQARLKNLGYYAGKVDGMEDKATRSAIEEFQCDYRLTVDGIVGAKTRAKLKEVHGC